MLAALALVLLTAPVPATSAGATELELLLEPPERRKLEAMLAAVSPPERLLELCTMAARQRALGGGFHGLAPEPLDRPDCLPVVRDADTLGQATLALARERAAARAALASFRVPYPSAFAGAPVPTAADSAPAEMRLTLDVNVPVAFIAAFADGAVDETEAAAIASLPANREMLRHRRDLGSVPAPLPDEVALAALIRLVASGDPVARIWAWISPLNGFGYADLASAPAGWVSLLAEIERNGSHLTRAALARVARYAPAGASLDERFGLTIGPLVRGWATETMAGLNLEQTKDDWTLLTAVLTEETYHRVQLRVCPTAAGARAADFEALARLDSGSVRLDSFYAALTYTVLEGTANLARGASDAARNAARSAARSGAHGAAHVVRCATRRTPAPAPFCSKRCSPPPQPGGRKRRTS